MMISFDRIRHSINSGVNQNNIIIGDSVAEGAGFAQGWIRSGGEKYRNVVGTPAYYMEQYTGMFWLNMGKDSDNSTEVKSRWITHVAPYNPPNILVHVGINDINDGRTEQQTKVTLDELMDYCAVANYKTIFCSLPYQTANGKLSVIQSINSWLATHVEIYGHGFVNYYPYVETWGGNPAKYVDDIHPKAAGYLDIISQYVIPVMQSKGWL